jgi:hypothetical protein
MMPPKADEVVPMFTPLLLDEPVPVNGRMKVPETPGFGVRLNPECALTRPRTDAPLFALRKPRARATPRKSPTKPRRSDYHLQVARVNGTWPQNGVQSGLAGNWPTVCAPPETGPPRCGPFFLPCFNGDKSGISSPRISLSGHAALRARGEASG